MQENDKYSDLLFNAKEEEIRKLINNLKEENERLELENDQLKKDLEKEQILHKNLYNEWKELTSGVSVKKSEPVKVRRYIRKKSSKAYFFGVITIGILLAVSLIYWAFSKNPGNVNPGLVPLTDTLALDTTKHINTGIIQKSTIAKPTIQDKEKKNDINSSSEKGINPRVNTIANEMETAGSQKLDSMLFANKSQQK